MSNSRNVVDHRSKREIIDAAAKLDERRQAQIGRQIDSINRLLELQDRPPTERYEAELLHLNTALAGFDLAHEDYKRVWLRLKIKCTQLAAQHRLVDPAEVLELLKEIDLGKAPVRHGPADDLAPKEESAPEAP